MTEDETWLSARLRGSPRATALVVMGGFCVVTMGIGAAAVGLLAGYLGTGSNVLLGGLVATGLLAGLWYRRQGFQEDTNREGDL